MTTAKPWYQSKTIWLNIFALIILVADGLGFAGFTPDPWVPEVGGIILAVLNILLRYVHTEQPIAK